MTDFYNLGVSGEVSDFYAKNNYYKFYVSGDEIVDYDGIKASESITFVGTTILNSTDGTSYPSDAVFDAPRINMESTISIRNNVKNSITFNNSSVNFDSASYNTNSSYIGYISFTGNSSINITASSNNKTLIKASTLTGTVDLDIDGSNIVESVSFSIQATTNSLIINTPTGWTVTPSTSGDITTYIVARVQLPNVKELNINNTTYQIKDEYARRQLNNIAETKQDVIPDLDTIRSGASAGATAVQPATLSDYVTINTSQTITNDKTFSASVNFTYNMSIECNPSIKSGNYFAFPQIESGLTIYRPAIRKNDSDNTFNLGNSSYFNLRFLGLETRPKYNGNDLALKSDVPTQASDIGAVASNTAITGATKCKITYDSKGLVTAGADLQASDIPDLSSTYQTSLTAGTGISISSGTISATDPVLINTANHVESLTIWGDSSSRRNTINIGKHSSAAGADSVMIGAYSSAGEGAFAIGNGATSNRYGFALLGKSTADYAYQLGRGTNSETESLYVGWDANYNYKLIDKTGIIPVDRISVMIGADGTNAGTKGLVPAPTATDNTKFLKGNGTWGTATKVTIKRFT